MIVHESPNTSRSWVWSFHVCMLNLRPSCCEPPSRPNKWPDFTYSCRLFGGGGAVSLTAKPERGGPGAAFHPVSTLEPGQLGGTCWGYDPAGVSQSCVLLYWISTHWGLLPRIRSQLRCYRYKMIIFYWSNERTYKRIWFCLHLSNFSALTIDPITNTGLTHFKRTNNLYQGKQIRGRKVFLAFKIFPAEFSKSPFWFHGHI